MSTPVNRSQLELYILGELDDAASAEVERLVAEDPAWAAALQAEAQLEMAVFEVADAAPSPVAESVAAKAPSPTLGERLWRTLFGPAGLGLAVAAMAAMFVVFSGPASQVELPPYQLEMNGGEAAVRSAPKPGPQGVPTYTRGSTLSMVVRPQTRVIASPQVDVLLDGAPLTGVKLDHLDGGTVEISGVFSEDLVEPTPGEHRLLVRVGGQEARADLCVEAAEPLSARGGREMWRSLLLLALSACSSRPEPEGVLFSGCLAVLPGRTCVAPEGKVVLWIPRDLPGAALKVAGAEVAIAGEEVDGGVRMTVEITEGTVELTARSGRWRMDVVPKVEGLTECVAGGEAELQALADGPAGLCLGQRGSRRFGAGDPDAALLSWAQAAPRLQAAGWAREAKLIEVRSAWVRADQAEFSGEISDYSDTSDGALWWPIWYARGQIASGVGNHRLALTSLRRSREIASRTSSSENVADLDERMALLEARLGRPQASAARYDLAFSSISQRPCWTMDRALAYAWGLELLREGGVSLHSLPRSERLGASPDPTTLLRVARKAYEEDPVSCRGRNRGSDLLVNEALDSLANGDLTAADASLDGAEASARNADTELWMYEARARLLLAKGQVDGAKAAWHLVSELADKAGDLEMRWRALDGLGRAALVDGGLEGALIPWDASRELFVRQSVLVPLRHGRGTFLDQRSPVVAAHLRTLLELGRPADAFEMARAWRAQLLATTWLVDRIGALDDTGRLRWDGVVADVDRLRHERERLLDKRRAAPSDEVQRIEEQLRRVEQQESDALDTGMSALSLGTDSAGRPREPGETRLLVLTATRPVGQGPLEIWAKGPDLPSETGYLPIVQDDRGVAAGAWVSAAEVAAAPERLLAVLAGRLEGARSITLLLPGSLESVDLHAVKVGDRSLIQRAPVSWSIDRAANAMLRGTGAAHRALVVGDPGGGLAGARDEAAAVARQLRSQGWQVTLLSGAAARLPAVLAELGGDGVELLHFAGHGEMGEDAWDARLVLAGGTVLGVRDVLALEHPPRLVVLAGCETARSEGIGIAGMGLAQAFVNAGSEAVVATARKVDDHLARRFSSAWYADGAALDAPGAGFQRVVEGLSVSESSADWAGFRLISR